MRGMKARIPGAAARWVLGAHHGRIRTGCP